MSARSLAVARACLRGRTAHRCLRVLAAAPTTTRGRAASRRPRLPARVAPPAPARAGCAARFRTRVLTTSRCPLPHLPARRTRMLALPAATPARRPTLSASTARTHERERASKMGAAG